MKKFLNFHYALIVLALGIAVTTIYAKAGRNQKTATKPNDSLDSTMKNDSSTSSTNSNRRINGNPTSQASKAPLQMREMLRNNIAQEKRDQLVARFEKWSKQDVAVAIIEFKHLNEDHKNRIIHNYILAYSSEWIPTEQHWNFLKACIDENASCKLLTKFAQSCSYPIFAQALERLLIHMYQTNPDEAVSWFKNIYNPTQDYNLYLFFQDKTKTLFGISTSHIIVPPHPANDLPQQDIPEITAPNFQE